MLRCTTSAVSFLRCAIRGTALIVLTCLCSTFSAQANAWQDGTPELEPRDFHNTKGDVITNGLLVSSDGNKVAVTSVNGQIEIRLSELAAEELVFATLAGGNLPATGTLVIDMLVSLPS